MPTITAIYDVWGEWPAAEAAAWVRRRWRNSHQAEDVLAGGQELFARRARPGYPLPRRIRFAVACCRAAARQQRLLPRRAAKTGDWATPPEVLTAGEDMPEVSVDMWRHLEVRDLLGRAAQAARMMREPLRQGVEEVLAGADQVDAARAAGVSRSALSVALRRIGEAVLGQPVTRQRRRQRDAEGQLALQL